MSVRNAIKVLPKEGAVLKQDEIDFIAAVAESIPAHTYLKDLFSHDFINWITAGILNDADCNIWLHWQQAEAESKSQALVVMRLQERILDLSKNCEQVKAERDESQLAVARIQGELHEAQYNGSALLQQFDGLKAEYADLITADKMKVQEIATLKAMLYAVVMDTSDSELKTAARMLVYEWGK